MNSPSTPTPIPGKKAGRPSPGMREEDKDEDRGALDEQLVLAVRRGESKASQPFYERIQRPVLHTLHQILGRSDHEFDDVFQLAVERVVQSVMKGSYEGRCNLGTWASVVTSRIAIDHLRRRRHERRLFWRRKDKEPNEEELRAPHAQRPDEQSEALRQIKAIREALSEISPDKAQTVVLFEVLGQDLNQIAESMGVSVAAAQSRLVRGRRELSVRVRQRLGENGHE